MTAAEFLATHVPDPSWTAPQWDEFDHFTALAADERRDRTGEAEYAAKAPHPLLTTDTPTGGTS